MKDRRLRIYEDAEKLANFLEEYLKEHKSLPSEATIMLKFRWSPRQLQPRYYLALEILREKRKNRRQS